MTEIGFVIQSGEAIPEDVTAFTSGRDRVSLATGATYTGNPWLSASCAGQCIGHAADEFEYPLTVTAVRPQPAPAEDLVHHHTSGDDLTACGLDAWTDPEEENPDNWVHSTDRVGSVTCTACLEKLRGKPADESVDLLDLVRQYSAESFQDGFATAESDEEGSDHYDGKARRLYDRIEAEVNRLRGRANGWTVAVENVRRVEAERDEALAEVERLKANVRAEGEISDSYAAWADWLAHAAIERLGVPLTDEGHDEVWEVALKALQAPATPAPDPLVLSLPSVPDGATALVASNEDGIPVRFERRGPDGWARDDDEPAWGLIYILREFGAVSVVMREPRTWPAIDDAPEEVKAVRGVSGRIWRRSEPDPREWECAEDGRSCLSFGDLQSFDGPLVEVFDEDGTR